MLRVAIVGYDHVHLSKYAPAIAAHRGAKIVAIVAAGANQGNARADAERYGARFFTSLAEMLREVEVDAAYLGTPPVQHLDVLRELAPRGIHTLVDKPIATTLADADAMIEVARRHAIKLMVPFNPRFQLPVIKLKAMLDEGGLGELQHLHATKFGKIPRNIPNTDSAWFFEAEQAGFGGFGDIGIHAVDGLRWLAGSEVRRVHASVGRHLHPDLAIDDFGTAILEFENGVTASLQAGWANPAGNPSWLSVAFEAFGSTGTALIDRPYHDFEATDAQKLERVPWWRVDVARLVDEFVAAIEEDRAPAITGEDARAALEIVLACYESSATGDSVTLPRRGKAVRATTTR